MKVSSTGLSASTIKSEAFSGLTVLFLLKKRKTLTVLKYSGAVSFWSRLMLSFYYYYKFSKVSLVFQQPAIQRD
jgi:hypothetical protein